MKYLLFGLAMITFTSMSFANETDSVLKCTRKLVQKNENTILAKSYLGNYLISRQKNMPFELYCPKNEGDVPFAEINLDNDTRISQVIDGFKNLTYTCDFRVLSTVLAAAIGVEVGAEGEICQLSDGRRWFGAGMNLGVGVGLGAVVSVSGATYKRKGNGYNPIVLTKRELDGMIATTSNFGDNNTTVKEDDDKYSKEYIGGVAIGFSPALFAYGYRTLPKFKNGKYSDSRASNAIVKTKLFPLKNNFDEQKKILGL